MTKDISAMAFWKAAGLYSEGVSHRFTDSPIYLLTYKDISAMAFWKAAGPYSEGVFPRFTDLFTWGGKADP